MKPHKKFKAEVYVLSKEEGGRHTPFFTNYWPQFYFRTTDVTGSVKLAEGVEMVMPGDNVSVEWISAHRSRWKDDPVCDSRRRQNRRRRSRDEILDWLTRRAEPNRSVAQLERAVSKTVGWGFESLLTWF